MVQTYVLRVNRAEFLNSYKYSGKRDTFCTLKLGDQSINTKTAVNGGKYPHWEQKYHIYLYGTQAKITLEVYESKEGGESVFLGSGVADLEQLKGKTEQPFWVELTHEGKEIGTVILACQQVELEPSPQLSNEPKDHIISVPNPNPYLKKLAALPKTQRKQHATNVITETTIPTQKNIFLAIKGLREKIAEFCSHTARPFLSPRAKETPRHSIETDMELEETKGGKMRNTEVKSEEEKTIPIDLKSPSANLNLDDLPDASHSGQVLVRQDNNITDVVDTCYPIKRDSLNARFKTKRIF